MDIQEVDVLVIGAGAVGLSVAWELSRAGCEVIIFERRARVGEEQSSRSSGVNHAGIYYPTGSRRARLSVLGNRLLYEFCPVYDIPCRRLGKYVVATKWKEIKRLEEIKKQAEDNGVEGCEIVNGSDLKKPNNEPNVRAKAALFVPSSGILDTAAFLTTLAKLCKQNGVAILTKTEVQTIFADVKGPVVKAVDILGGEFYVRPRILVNAAGLDSARIAKLINPANLWEMAFTRGEYVKFDMRKRDSLVIKHLIYSVPQSYLGLDDNLYRTLGIHLTPTFTVDHSGKVVVGSEVLVGPSARQVAEPTDQQNLYRVGHFVRKVRPFFSELKYGDCRRDYYGVTARLGAPHSDWIIERDRLFPNCVHSVGIDSPGLTAALAIGPEVRELVRELI